MVQSQVKTDFSPMEIYWMVWLLSVKNDDYLNISRLATSIGTSPTNPPFRKVISHLLDQGIITARDSIGNSKVVTVHHHKLRDLLDEQDYINHLVENYLEPFHIFEW